MIARPKFAGPGCR